MPLWIYAEMEVSVSAPEYQGLSRGDAFLPGIGYIGQSVAKDSAGLCQSTLIGAPPFR